MRRILFALLLVALQATSVFAAPLLAWDPVTTGVDGSPLGADQVVISYQIYKCGPSASGSCAAPDRVLVGSVEAPTVEFDLAGQPVPQSYAVTAVNIVGESLDSLKYKVTPPDMPKNLRLP